MDFVSNFIYLSKVNGSWWMYYVLFFFTSKEIRSRIEIYVNAYHVYRSCCWRRYNSTNQNTWNKLQISIKILSCTKIKFEFDMGLNVPSFTCIDFFHETITIKLLTSAFWSIKEWLAKFFVYHSIVCFKPT